MIPTNIGLSSGLAHTDRKQRNIMFCRDYLTGMTSQGSPHKNHLTGMTHGIHSKIWMGHRGTKDDLDQAQGCAHVVLLSYPWVPPWDHSKLSMAQCVHIA